MSEPQGPDPTQQWQPTQGEGQQSGEAHTQHVSPWQQSSGEQGWQATGGEQQTWQAPAYTPTEYGQYQQPPTSYYPPSQSYPQGYPQQDQYGGQTAAYPQQPGQYRPPPAGPDRSAGPAWPIRSAGSVRASRPVPPTRSVRPVPGCLRPAAGRPEALEGDGRLGARCACRRRRRGDLGAWLLGAGVLRDHQAGRQQSQCRRTADPDR